MLSRPTTLLRGLCVLLSLLFGAAAVPERVQAGPLEEGQMSFGLSGGGSSDSVAIGAQFGYFVLDGLRLGASFQYQYRDFSRGSGHFLEPGLNARYYIGSESAGFYFFPLIDVSYINFRYDGDALSKSSYDYFQVAPGGGVLFMFTPTVGFEFSAAAVFSLGQDQELIDSNVAPDSAQFRWGFGMLLLF